MRKHLMEAEEEIGRLKIEEARVCTSGFGGTIYYIFIYSFMYLFLYNGNANYKIESSLRK